VTLVAAVGASPAPAAADPLMNTAGFTAMTFTTLSHALFLPAETAWYWSWVSYFTSYGSRGHVVQLCIVIMCLALFIMMKKLTGGRR
jgi:hypothetical protein